MCPPINLLFLVLCLFTGDICCDNLEDDYVDKNDTDSSHEYLPTIPNNYGGEDSQEKDDPEGHRDGTILIVVISVVGFVVSLIVVTGVICILKKCNRNKIETSNFQDTGMMEKHQIAFTTPTIYPDNPPPYTPKMEEGETKSVPMEFLGHGTGWYATTIVSMPPPYTKVVGQASHPDSTAAPAY